MTEISLENEKFVEGLVASGQFVSRQAALDEAVQLLREQFPFNGLDVTNDLSAQAWCNRFQQWAVGHKALPREADDSRESIYAGRGQ